MARIEPWQYIAPDKPQFQLVVRRFAPFARFSGFEGDNRTFSTSELATYRTGVFVTFDLAKGRITEGPIGHSAGTRRHDNEPKYWANVRVRLKHLQGDLGRIMFGLHIEGSNPGAEGLLGRLTGLVSPNIDMDIEFTAFLKDGNLFTAGKLIGDGFPHAEVFLRDNRRSGHMLLRFQTPHGPSLGPVMRLPLVGIRNLGMFKEGITLDNSMRFIGTTRWRS